MESRITTPPPIATTTTISKFFFKYLQYYRPTQVDHNVVPGPDLFLKDLLQNGMGFDTGSTHAYVDLGDWSGSTCALNPTTCEQGKNLFISIKKFIFYFI